MKATFTEGVINLTDLGFEFGFEDVNRCAAVQMQNNFLAGVFFPMGTTVMFMLNEGVQVTHELMQGLHAVFSAVWDSIVLEYELDDAHNVIATTGHRLSVR
jgi:hypothetical protein